jgi:DnaJ-class molecular chaperone
MKPSSDFKFRIPVSLGDIDVIITDVNQVKNNLQELREVVEKFACSRCEGSGIVYNSDFTTGYISCRACEGTGFNKDLLV